MNAIEKINAKFDKIESMFVQYYAMDESASAVESSIWNRETDTIDWRKHHEWCRLYEENRVMERKIRRAVRTLANDMGFEIKKREFMSLILTWESIFNEIRGQWRMATTALYDAGWGGFRTIKQTQTGEQE